MQETIQWLMKIEQLARDIYFKAAVYFKDNRPLAEFLERTASDEAWHFNLMTRALDDFKNISTAPLQYIEVDPETRNKIEAAFSKINEQISDETLSEFIILDQILTVEFSEWNDVFIFVISCFKEQGDTFKHVSAKIQGHKRYIENFVESRQHGQELLDKIRAIPAIWRENILIVDDEPMISDLIKAILHREGAIDTASDGQDAFKRLKEKYYKLVISDVDMPIQDGLSFYRQAVELFPEIKHRFIFITGDASPDRVAFFEQHNLKYLQKPVPINVIRAEALKVLINC